MRFYGRVAAASDAFAECVDETMRNGLDGFGPYLECSGDPHTASSAAVQAERALAVARSTNDLAIKCSGGGGLASAGYDTYGHTSDEAFSFSGWLMGVVSNLGEPLCTAAQKAAGGAKCRWAAFPWPYTQAAGVVWHEAMHTHGYRHGDDSDNTKAAKACGHEGDASFHFQRDTVPYIVGNCIDRVLARSHSTRNGGLLAARCADGARQLVASMSGNACECVHDPALDHGVVLLTGEGTDALDTPLTIESDEWATSTWRPSSPVAIGGGDFNGDGRSDVLLRESSGTGTLVMAGHDGSGGAVRIAHNPVGTRIGDWMLGDADIVAGVGNIDGWLDDEVVIRSGWGLGVVGHYNGWQSYAMHPYGADLGSGWTLAAGDDVAAVADLDGDGRDELLLKAADGALGIAELSGDTLQVTRRHPNGAWLGSWHTGPADEILGAADFDADGTEELLVRSGWGLGVLGLGNAGLAHRAMWANHAWGGGWLLWPSDEVAAIGDFDGDDRAEVVLRDVTRTALLEMTAAGGFSMTTSVDHGDWIDGAWLLNRTDVVVGVADFYGSGRDALVLRSGWGIGVVEYDGNDLAERFLTPVGTLAGTLLLESGDDFHGRSGNALIVSR